MINSFFYQIFQDFKIVLIPTMILNSYALYFFFKNYRKTIADGYELAFVFLFTFLNPQILMWTNSLRWYAVWTPLFIIVYSRILTNKNNKGSFFVSIILLSIMFYINYITIIIFFPLLAIYAYNNRNKIFSKEIIFSILFFMCVTGFQAYKLFSVHIHNLSSQTYYSLGRSVGMGLYSTFIGNSMTPWNPITILFSASIVFLCLTQIRSFTNIIKSNRGDYFKQSLFFLIFILFFFISSKLAGKMRNTLFLQIIAMTIIGYFIELNRGTIKKIFLGSVFLFIISSSFNLIVSKYLLNESKNLPVKGILEIVNKFNDSSTYIYTHDPVLNYYLSSKKSHLVNKDISVNKGSTVIIIKTYEHLTTSDKIKEKNKYYLKIISKLTKIKKFDLGYDYGYKVKYLLRGYEPQPYYCQIIIGEAEEKTALKKISG